MLFESSVNSYGSKTHTSMVLLALEFESSVNSYGSKTELSAKQSSLLFESSINLYGSKTNNDNDMKMGDMRV